MAHTKGPWKYTPGEFNLDSTSEQPDSIKSWDGWYIATIENIRSEGETLANARLIAVAPHLLEACQEAAKFIARCQKAIEADDPSLLPNEAERFGVENSLWAAIDDAVGEVSNV